MKKNARAARESLDRWMDERIRVALSVLTTPMENRIKKLRRRIETLQSKIRHLGFLSEQRRETQEKLRQGEKSNSP